MPGSDDTSTPVVSMSCSLQNYLLWSSFSMSTRDLSFEISTITLSPFILKNTVDIIMRTISSCVVVKVWSKHTLLNCLLVRIAKYLLFCSWDYCDSDLRGVLFLVKIDPYSSSTPSANIHDGIYYQTKEGMVFSKHSIVWVRPIKLIDNSNNRL